MITDPPISGYSNVGYALVGSALGSFLSFTEALSKIGGGSFTLTQFAATILFAVSASGGISCLLIASRLKKQSKGMAEIIRHRDKQAPLRVV